MQTAVLKVITNVLRAADHSILYADTVNHDVLIDYLQQSFGILGLAHSWIDRILSAKSDTVSQHCWTTVDQFNFDKTQCFRAAFSGRYFF